MGINDKASVKAQYPPEPNKAPLSDHLTEKPPEATADQVSPSRK